MWRKSTTDGRFQQFTVYKMAEFFVSEYYFANLFTKPLMKNYYKQTLYLTSASKASEFPELNGIEIAFAGRSNAGKSSSINTLCDITNLARTSKTPGRTQLINFFQLDDERRLVDLPGYGYAKVPEKVRKDWQKLMEDYISQREQLAGLVIIMDIRHPLKDYDLQMLEWCQHFNIPVHILLTKADKLKRGAGMQSLLSVKKALETEQMDASVQIFSALKSTGLKELQTKLNEWYQL